MKLPDRFFLIIFLISIIALFISVGLIISKTSLLDSTHINLPFKANGAFIIESPTQVDSSGTFDLRIIADSDNKESNAVALYVQFDPQKLNIVSMDTSSSFCQFYPKNKFDNNIGNISIECGAPSPGFKGQNTIASIKFMPRNIGETEIEILDKSEILLNNGKGDNIFSKNYKYKISILNTI
jgi:hypothetical protein